MTPAARIAAAIEILDRIQDGVPAEKALTTWARQSRFAGSKDRAVIRDHVFDVLRCKRSAAAAGGADTGRGLMIGLLRLQEADLDTVFTGEGHAPAPLGAHDPVPVMASQTQALDLPDWLWPEWQRSLGDKAAEVANAQRTRAAVFLRVNLLRTDVAGAQTALAADGIITRIHPLSDTALEVTEGARKVAQSVAYRDGLVELQDAASQAVITSIPDRNYQTILDYCAGGGGKSLALAARFKMPVTAHDAHAQRMKDLPDRAVRAGAKINILKALEPGYDLVLTDVPCSGSGAWRRQPEGKWRLTEEMLVDLTQVQSEILRKAKDLVAENGVLSYATCSVLKAENDDRIDAFLEENAGWICLARRQFLPQDGGDGFFAAHLTRDAVA